MEDLLAVFTGTDKMPPLGFLRKPTLRFSSINIYPTSSTCALILMLPMKYGSDYNSFKAAMHTGLKYHGGFDNV